MRFGIYYRNDKRILLSEKFVRNSLKNGKDGTEDFFEVFTHEVYHALSKDENGKDRLASTNCFNGKYNSTLLETIVETAADRTVFNRTEQDKYYFRKETKGYPEMTFVVPALAATYGVSEKEFLQHAIMGRNDLISFLSTVAKEPQKRTASFLDGIELNLSKMHKALYSKTASNISKDERTQLISESIYSISYMCNTKLEERYEKEPITDEFAAYYFVENAKYNHIKLHSIIDKEIEELNSYYGVDVVPIITDMRQEAEFDELETIIDMDKVVSSRQNFLSREEYLRVFNYARRGMLSNLDPQYLYEKNLIHRKGQNSFSRIDQRVLDKFDNDDFQANSWNNNNLSYYVSKYIPDVLPRRIVSDVKDKIEQLFYSRRSFLPQATMSRNEGATDHFRLSEKELDDFNKKAKDALNNSKEPKSQKKSEQIKEE